jgi:hypothetical protein
VNARREVDLLRAIKRRFPPERQARYGTLVSKRQDEAISPEELQVLIRLTNQIEQQDVDRLATLTELAQLRGSAVSALMSQLGIVAPPSD